MALLNMFEIIGVIGIGRLEFRTFSVLELRYCVLIQGVQFKKGPIAN